MQRILFRSIASGAFYVTFSQAFSSVPFSISPPSRKGRTHHIQCNCVDIDEDVTRDIQSMEDWAENCGAQRADGFQIAQSNEEQYDFFAMTTQDLPANSPVLYVPSEMILSSNNVAGELGYGTPAMEAAEKVVLQNTEATDDSQQSLRQYYLMLKILAEYEKGDDSPWFPWLNSLPRYFSNGASMTPFCFKCLPSFTASLARKERAHLNHLRVRQVPFLSEQTKCNEPLWTWAYQVVITRSFETDDGDLCIAPLADMFNHGSSTEADIAIAYDEEGNCHVQTTRDVPGGSPLLMSYGDPTNPSHLLAKYGFLDETSPATFCKLEPPSLHLNQYPHNTLLFYKDTGEVSPQVWDILLYQLLPPDRRREVMDDESTMRQLQEEYYPQMSAKLLEHIDGFLDQLEELNSKSLGRDVHEHPRLPLILKHNDFVRSTFLAVRATQFEQ